MTEAAQQQQQQHMGHLRLCSRLGPTRVGRLSSTCLSSSLYEARCLGHCLAEAQGTYVLSLHSGWFISSSNMPTSTSSFHICWSSCLLTFHWPTHIAKQETGKSCAGLKDEHRDNEVTGSINATWHHWSTFFASWEENHINETYMSVVRQAAHVENSVDIRVIAPAPKSMKRFALKMLVK